jgi:hypothetical protein
MEESATGTPDLSSAQVPVTPNVSQGSPSKGNTLGAQGVSTDSTELPQKGAEQTSGQGESSEGKGGLLKEEEVVVPEWQKRGFKSEEALYASFDEGQSTIGRVNREKALLAKENEIYQQYADGKVANSDLNGILTEQRDIARREQESATLEKERIDTALELFRLQHSELTGKDILSICRLAPQEGNYADRLQAGKQLFESITEQAKKEAVLTQQQDMSEKSEVITGSSTKPEVGKLPSFKDMSSVEFKAFKQQRANR